MPKAKAAPQLVVLTCRRCGRRLGTFTPDAKIDPTKIRALIVCGEDCRDELAATHGASS